MRMLWLLVAVALIGCKPKTPRDQADAFNDRPSFMGALDADLQVIEKKTNNPRSGTYLEWAGIDGDRICVTRDYMENRTITEAEIVANYERGLQKSQIAFGAYDSLSQVPAQWPAKPTNSVGSVVKHYSKNEGGFENGDDKDWWMVHLVVQLCAPAPEIKPSTRFITATTFGADQPDLFVWQIKGTPKPRAASSGGTTTAPEPSTDSPPTSTPTPTTTDAPTVAAGTKNIIDALKAQGGFTEFLIVVACAGKEAELAKGQFTVLAFDDATVRKRITGEQGRKKMRTTKCAGVYQAHVSSSALPASAFKVGAEVEVKTFDGSTRTFKVEEGARVIEATNGVIYVVDEVNGR